jgi:hypothetical protein
METFRVVIHKLPYLYRGLSQMDHWERHLVLVVLQPES